MFHASKTSRLILAAVVYVAVDATVLWHDRSPALSQTGPETPKQVYEDRCSACHNAYDPAAQALTMTQWRSTVNRMLYRHGASAEITPAQTQTILTYLATFALPEPTPRHVGIGHARLLDNSDVWASAPTYSRVFVFGADDALASSLQTASTGIAWKILGAEPAQQLALRAKDNVPGPDLLLLPTPSQASGALRVEAVFQRPSLAPPVAAPLSFGVTFGAQMNGDAREYDIARYDARRGIVDLIATTGKATKIIDTKEVDTTQLAASTPNAQHTLRVDLLGSRVKVWLDYDKVIDTTLPAAPQSPVAGVWTGSRASVKSVAVDIYPSVS